MKTVQVHLIIWTTLVVQPLKLSAFRRKCYNFNSMTLLSICDFSADFRILFGMWNTSVMSYPCAKFKHDMAINNLIIIFDFCFVYSWTNDKSLSIMTSLIFLYLS